MITVILMAAMTLADGKPVSRDGTCVSERTAWDGVRKQCAGIVCIDVGESGAIRPESWLVRELGRVGDGACEAAYIDRLSVIGGWAQAVTRVCARFHVTSPHGLGQRPGEIKCRLDAVVH